MIHIISKFVVDRTSGTAGSRGPMLLTGLASLHFLALLSSLGFFSTWFLTVSFPPDGELAPPLQPHIPLGLSPLGKNQAFWQ